MTQWTIDQAFQWAHQQHVAGRFVEAEGVYRQILAQDPNYAPALHYLGTLALLAGQLDDALALLRRSIAINANVPGCHHHLAITLWKTNQPEEAIAEFRAAITLSPRMAVAYEGMGNALSTLRRHDEAVAAFQTALQLEPDSGVTYCNLGSAESALGHFTAANRSLQRAAELLPEQPSVHANLANLLLNSGQIDGAIESHRKAHALVPAHPEFWSNLLLALNYHSTLTPRQILAEHQQWGQSLAAPHTLAAAPLPNDRSPDRRLRIGFVSGDFREHPIAYFMAPFLRNYDRRRLDVFCYSDAAANDAFSARLRTLPDHWRIYRTTDSDDHVASLIRSDAIDILIDLAGHTAGNRLLVFARKPALVQATYLGYPNTTGVSAIDWRITDAVVDLPGEADALHTERLMRLPGCAWCYEPPTDAPDVAPAPVTSNGFITFGSFNNFAKVSPKTIALWAGVLRAMPTSRMLIKASGLHEAETTEDIRKRFAEHSITPDQLELIGRTTSFEDHLRAYARVDIALDTFPYHGTTTTCEALWMGVPAVTLAGHTHVSRVSASLLSAVGLGELAASDADGYVAAAKHLAADTEKLASMRASMRDRLRASPLCDGPEFSRRFETALRSMWAEWIAH